MKVASEVIAQLCREHAGDLLTPKDWEGAPLDKIRLLWGLAGVESSFGWRSNPHHDASYCVGGRHFNHDSTAAWGCLAHCSFGPWQVEYPNLAVGVSPLSLMWVSDGRVAAELCVRDAVRVLNRAILQGARHLADIVHHYNGPGEVEKYQALLVGCMERPMPETVAPVNA